MKNSKRKFLVPFLIVTITILVIGAGTYYSKNENSFTNQTSDLKSYTNNVYGFSFEYPNNLSVYEWGPNNGMKYSVGRLVTEQGTGNNMILSQFDYSKQLDAEYYGKDITSIRISEENGEAWIKNSTDAEDFYNKLTKYDDKGMLVNKFSEERIVNGTKFIVFEQYGWSVAAQKYLWNHQALFAHNSKFFWIRAEDSVSEEEFNTFINSFEFSAKS